MSAISGSKGPDFTVIQASQTDNQHGPNFQPILQDPRVPDAGCVPPHRRDDLIYGTGDKHTPLPEVILADADEHPSEVRHHTVDVPGPLPDTDAMSPEQIYDLFAGYVDQFGSQEAKDDLAAGRKVALEVYVDGKFAGVAVLDGSSKTGMFYASDVGRGVGGSSDPSLFHSGGNPEHTGKGSWPELPPFFADIFNKRSDVEPG